MSVHINCTCGYNNSLSSLKLKYLTNISSDVSNPSANPELLLILDTLSSTYDFDSEDSILLFVHRVCKELLITNVEFALQMLREYVKYMALLVLRRKNRIAFNFFKKDLVLIPSSRIYSLWRFHILYSSKYIEFCQKLNGGERFHLDLNKFFNLDVLLSEEKFQDFKWSYENFQEVYKFYYGEMKNQEIWPEFHKNTIEYVFRFCLFPVTFQFLNQKHQFEEKAIIPDLVKNANSSTLSFFRKDIVKTLNALRETTGMDIEQLKQHISIKLLEESKKDPQISASEKIDVFFNGNISVISEIKTNEQLWEKYKYCSTFAFPENFEYILSHEMLLDSDSIDKLILDYRRFLFLRCYRPKMVFTPSEEVDVVWHLHLNFTYFYWITMKKLLGYEYLHNPTKGGKQELDKHTSLYDNTLDIYKKLYGNSNNINWPGGKQRFSQNPYWFFLTEKYVDGRLEPKKQILKEKEIEEEGMLNFLSGMHWKTIFLVVVFLVVCMVIGGYLGYMLTGNGKISMDERSYRNRGGD